MAIMSGMMTPGIAKAQYRWRTGLDCRSAMMPSDSANTHSATVSMKATRVGTMGGNNELTPETRQDLPDACAKSVGVHGVEIGGGVIQENNAVWT